MDDYPEHLAPEFEESGAVKTPFDEWWARVQPHFANVPENVARHWLHEHWDHSPARYLPSADYTFKLVEWPAENLQLIRSRWCDWEPENSGCLAHGAYLITEHEKRPPEVYTYKTAAYMVEHGEFPAPIIVLDNRDGHLHSGRGCVPRYEDLPAAYFLVEGHRRFNMGLYLHSLRRLRPTLEVWLMEHRSSRERGSDGDHGSGLGKALQSDCSPAI